SAARFGRVRSAPAAADRCARVCVDQWKHPADGLSRDHHANRPERDARSRAGRGERFSHGRGPNNTAPLQRWSEAADRLACRRHPAPVALILASLAPPQRGTFDASPELVEEREYAV